MIVVSRCAALAVLTLLVASTQAAHAANVLYFDPSAGVFPLSGQLSVDLAMDFSDTTTGGGVVLGYDPAILDLADITFASSFPGDPDFNCPGSTLISCPSSPGFLSFGSFVGLTGQHTIASLRFDAVGTGSTGLSATIASSFDDGTGSPLLVSIQSSSIEVVPEPATATLIALGLLLGLGSGRRPGLPRL
jgi:hypothetical protein